MAENSSNTASGSHRSGVKRLIIMRHAEADWGLNDFDRPLTKRGHEQAAAAGAWLAARGYIPEQIMSSFGFAYSSDDDLGFGWFGGEGAYCSSG